MVAFPFEIEPSWTKELSDELQKPYITRLAAFVAQERRSSLPIYPPEELTFNAFWRTPFDKVSVVIVGQDPYHGAGQAHGLSFSVPPGIPTPPSLKNIYKELQDDLGISLREEGCLLHWAEQGVFLLNTVLTVRHQQPHSHKDMGWEAFTDAAIGALARRDTPVVFMLWGRPAQQKARLIDEQKRHKDHLILHAPHPSPFSAHSGFFGCRHFSKANEALLKWNRRAIDW